MTSRKDFELVREDDSQSFNSVMARERNLSKQRLIPERRETGSDGDSDDEGSWESLDEDYMYSLNQKARNGKKKSDVRLKVVAIASLIIIIVLVIFIAWQHFQVKAAAETCLTSDCVLTSAYILGKMNTTEDPCEDFYEYACGGWLTHSDIPPDKAKYGSFQEVDKKNKALLKKAFDSPGDKYKGKISTAINKTKEYYQTCMDTERIEDLGITPAQVLIKQLGSWSVTSDPVSGTWSEAGWNFLDTLIMTHKLNSAPLFSMSIVRDSKHSDKNLIGFQQAGLTLDGQEQYNNTNAEKYRDGFLGFATKFGELLGGDNSTHDKMVEIYNLEKRLAGIFMPKESLQDPVAIYHKMSLQDLQDILGDQISLQTYAKQIFNTDIPMEEEVLVYTVDYFKKLGAVIKDTPKEVMANYLVWQVLQALPGYLPDKFIDASLILIKAQSGVTAVSPRWQRCVYKTTSALPFAAGALFVEEKFSPDSKQKALKIIGDIKNSFMNNLQSVDWMDKQTREVAIDKVKAVSDMIGYPDYILDPEKLDKHYENLTVTTGQFLGNRMSALVWMKNFNLNKRGKTPDKSEWSMSPSEVNAYYSSSNNQIVFPAGILQRPYYNPDFPLSFQYGSLGMIVGHELTHGFDSTGRNYDKHGNLYDWWTNASAVAFKKKIQCMIDQYSNYKIEGINLNGVYTKSENIADNGGLKTAYSAYKKARRTAGDQTPLPGLPLSPEQLFYVGFAQIWCSFYTPQYAKATVVTDVHANSKYRVIGSVSNSADFSKAFKCSADSAMNPQKKCTVW